MPSPWRTLGRRRVGLVAAGAVAGGTAVDLGVLHGLLAQAPRRRQPSYPWLAAGGAIAIVLWLLATALLARYVAKTDTFRSTYGPLTSP